MLKKIVLLSVLLHVFLYATTIIADEKRNAQQPQTTSSKKAPPPSSASKTSPAYLNVPFDPDIQVIPVPYQGHNIEQVYGAFDSRKKADPKGEFETKDQYEKRLTAQATAPLFGSVRQDSLLAFILDPKVEYDADSQVMTITLTLSSVRQSSSQIDKARVAFEIKSNLTKQKSIRQNAYGAKVEVEETHVKGFDLAIHNISNF
jgi:hypothetical protein